MGKRSNPVPVDSIGDYEVREGVDTVLRYDRLCSDKQLYRRVAKRLASAARSVNRRPSRRH
jgi:hypothetical protein